MRVVISQSMLFPWVGMLEQINLADVFVHYDDVQFSKGSFTNRVQIKTPTGSEWMTVPLKAVKLGQKIDEVLIDSTRDWRSIHISKLTKYFDKAPYASDAIDLVHDVYGRDYVDIGSLARQSLLSVAHYFGLIRNTRFVHVDELKIHGSGSERVLNIVKSQSASEYITGLGARNYLDHKCFDECSIRVNYMRYECMPYSQLYGKFNPFVSSLDLIANCGRSGRNKIVSESIYWKDL